MIIAKYRLPPYDVVFIRPQWAEYIVASFDSAINFPLRMDLVWFIIAQVKKSWVHGVTAFFMPYRLERNIALKVLQLERASFWCHIRCAVSDKLISLQFWSVASPEATLFSSAAFDLGITLVTNKRSVFLLHTLAFIILSLLSVTKLISTSFPLLLRAHPV